MKNEDQVNMTCLLYPSLLKGGPTLKLPKALFIHSLPFPLVAHGLDKCITNVCVGPRSPYSRSMVTCVSTFLGRRRLGGAPLLDLEGLDNIPRYGSTP